MGPVEGLSKNLNFDVGDFSFSPSYFQAALIIFLIFILVLTLAQVRRHFIDWSIKGAIFGIFIGFLLALVLEGFLIIGGRTALTEVLGWKNAPKPLVGAIDQGRKKLVDVLRVTDEVPASVAKADPTVDDAVQLFQSLDPSESAKARSLICQP